MAVINFQTPGKKFGAFRAEMERFFEERFKVAYFRRFNLHAKFGAIAAPQRGAIYERLVKVFLFLCGKVVQRVDDDASRRALFCFVKTFYDNQKAALYAPNFTTISHFLPWSCVAAKRDELRQRAPP